MSRNVPLTLAGGLQSKYFCNLWVVDNNCDTHESPGKNPN